MEEEVQTKFCNKCQEDHPVSDFYKNKNTRDGLQTYCKAQQFKMNKKYITRLRDKDNRDEQYVKKGEFNRKEYSDVVNSVTRLYLDPEELSEFQKSEDGSFKKKIKLVLPSHFKVTKLKDNIEKSTYGDGIKRKQYTAISITIEPL